MVEERGLARRGRLGLGEAHLISGNPVAISRNQSQSGDHLGLGEAHLISGNPVAISRNQSQSVAIR